MRAVTLLPAGFAFPGSASSALGVGTQHSIACLVAPSLRSARSSVAPTATLMGSAASKARARDERVSGTKWSAPTDEKVLRANAACAAEQAGKSDAAPITSGAQK